MTTGTKLLIVFGAMVLVGIISAVIGICIETKLYNKGVCRICNQKLEFFDYDSRASRGYKCPLCSYTVWVSYDCVDKWLKNLNDAYLGVKTSNSKGDGHEDQT